jgi:hypothetical protein
LEKPQELKVKQKWLLAAFLAAFCVLNAVAADIDLAIRFYDKKVYHISGAEGEPIYVQVTVTNRSPYPYRFKLADERVFSVDFDVRNMVNQSLELADYIRRKRGESRNVYFREVVIEPGESFSFVEDIRNYALLQESGSFVVQARIFPELFRDPSPRAVLESNHLNLNLRPPAMPGPDGVPYQLDMESGAYLAREKLPPDEVVAYTLDARIKSQWEKFFLYLDLEAMITRDDVQRRIWLNESEEGRNRMINKYREDFKNGTLSDGRGAVPNDEMAIRPPSRYEIEKITHNGVTGEVDVLEWFTIGRITEKWRYTYYFRKQDDIWTIQYYKPVKLGTE